jgi:hypothetical protein
MAIWILVVLSVCMWYMAIKELISKKKKKDIFGTIAAAVIISTLTILCVLLRG